MKKIEELVYKGMVLDERGEWIPLAEKLRKEKEFLHHLELGEVLIDGLWARISAVPGSAGYSNKSGQVQIDSETPVPEETTAVPLVTPEETKPGAFLTPEETVSFSTDTLRDFMPDIVSVEPESDYPPETKIFSIVRPDRSGPSSGKAVKPPSPGDQAVIDETQIDFDRSMLPPVETMKAVTHETEFEETVLYNIKVLQQPTVNKPRLRTTDSAHKTPLSPSAPSDDDPDLESAGPKRKSTAVWVVVIIVAVILLLGILWFYR